MSFASRQPDALQLVFYDDATARTFEPFALSRPFCEMRAGALLIRERWELTLHAAATGFVGAEHLARFAEDGIAAFAGDVIPAGSFVVNSRAAITITEVLKNRPRRVATGEKPVGAVLTIGGRVAAVELTDDMAVSAFANGAITLESLQRNGDAQHTSEVDGVWIDEVWDVVRHLSALLLADIPVIAKARSFANVSSNNNGPVVRGRHALFVEDGATVEPFTYVDTSAGPVLIRSGSSVQAFTRLIGPCYIGRDCIVSTDRIAGSAIGDTCRVHGELSASVFIGHSNKGHDGFVGHSIVGRWVNMGAGTTTSNLKNTYGSVALWTPAGVRDTGLQFLGTLFGDHTKTGIGLKLTTGCVLGAAANVFDRMPSKVVEPFAWGAGAPYDSYDVNKFLESAARMMSRRNVELNDDGRAHLVLVHSARWRAS